MKLVRGIAAAAVLLGAWCATATAQNWPTKPVKIVAPFAPGGAADTLGRIIGEHLSSTLGQQFFIENRPGGGGMIGSAAVATAPNDGYTFVVSGIASHVISPAFNTTASFDALRDFTHIAYLGGPPIVLIVHKSLGVKTYKEFLEYARQSPKALDYISAGTGTHGFLFAEDLSRREGFKLTHVPYKGANPALMDLVAGHVSVGSMTFSSAAEQIRAGTVLPLAVSSDRRLPNFPDIPTFKELGYPDLVSATWFGLSAPAQLPRPIVDVMSREIEVALRLPAVQARMAQDAIEIRHLTPNEFTTLIEAEIGRWAPLAKALGAAGN